MQKQNKVKFLRATKGKVIIGFLFACVALAAAWGISRFAFKKMLQTVQGIAVPNDRLRMVSQVSNAISRLDQLQRDQAVNGLGKSAEFIQVSKSLRKHLDTLSVLYKSDRKQLARIRSIGRLLADRDKQFMMYLQVRETLVNTKSFSAEVSKLGDLIKERGSSADSSVFTETSTSTTTLAPEQEDKSRGLFARIFGKKKAEAYKIISEEYKIKRDTVNTAAEDSIVNSIESTLSTIEKEQRVKSARFLKREADLAKASAQITNQMLTVLREVEAEAVAQVDADSREANKVVNDGIGQITILLIASFLLTVILLYLILTDITKSHRYREELEQARDEAEYHSKAKQRFLSNMSHELRTPLQSILGYAEQISGQEVPKKKDIDAIYQSSEHLLQIVNELLDYNRIISGEFSFNNQPFDLAKSLDEVVAVMRPLAEKKNIDLLTAFDFDEVGFVNGDLFRLKQILFNLLGNAIKFTIKGHVLLSLSAKKQDGAVHLNFLVQDTGIGFDQDDVQRIFNEFEQVESKEKYAYNQAGSGLGLAIVKSLVEGQGGRINVRSRKGNGATFSFHLLYDLAQGPALNEGLKSAFLPNRQNVVWLVDDDNLILELCSLILTQAKIPHQTFNNATAVLSAPVQPNVSHVLLDMRLPEMSGVKLHSLLKQKMPNTVQYYAMTAQVLPDERAAILEEGFAGIMMKPFKAEELLSLFGDATPQPVGIAATPQPLFDLTNIERMTMGDAALLNNILEQFVTDCQQDTQVLQQALLANNQDEARLIVHRLAGRVAQVGAKDLATQLRSAELQVAQGITHAIKAQIEKHLQELAALMVAIKN